MPKKILLYILVTILAVLNPFSSSHSAQSGLITITVMIQNLSLSVSSSSYDFGVMGLGSSKVSGQGVAVLNDGNIAATISLSCANTASWTIGTPGTDTFRLSSQFDNDGLNMTWTPPLDYSISNLPLLSTITRFAGDQTGLNILPNTSRKLWFKLDTPTNTTAFAPQNIIVTLTAEAAN